MSRSDSQQSIENPVTKHIYWKSQEKSFAYFDKSKGEKGEEIFLPFPLKNLTYLEDMYCVSGYSEEHGKTIWSNEIKLEDFKKKPLTVRAGDTVIAEGIYSDIKEVISSYGGKFTASIYCMDDEGNVVNLKLKGSANTGIQTKKVKNGKTSYPWKEQGYEEKFGTNSTGWSNFWKNYKDDIITKRFNITQAIDTKNGAVQYSVPWFEVEEFDPSQASLIDEKEKEVITFLESRAKQHNDKPDTDDSVIEEQEEVTDAEI